MQTATAGSRALKPLANEWDAHIHQKVVAPFVIERVDAVHEVDDDAGTRAPCLRGGFNARRITEAVVGRESPWAQKGFLCEGVCALLGVVLPLLLLVVVLSRESLHCSLRCDDLVPTSSRIRRSGACPWAWAASFSVPPRAHCAGSLPNAKTVSS